MDFSHIKSSSRLESLSDATFSIVATVMILPIAHTELPEGNEYLGTKFAKLILPQLLVYVITFLIICNTWANHVWLFMSIKKVDDVTVLLNLALLMATSVFPFSFFKRGLGSYFYLLQQLFTLLGKYVRFPLAILLFCGVVAVVGLIQFFFVVHVFRHPELLTEVVRDNHKWRSQRNQMFASVLTPVIIASIAAAFVPVNPVLSDTILVLLLFGNFIRRNAIFIYKKIVERCRRPELEFSIEEEQPVRKKLFTQQVSKERVECFSDGVYAIVATLIVLDICENNVPDEDMVADHNNSLAQALSSYSPVFLSYMATFVTVGLLAYVHHSLLHNFKEMNLLMVGFNNMSLMCIGAFPLAFKMASEYASSTKLILRNETLAIQINCIAIFMAAACLSMLWIAALFNQKKYVLPHAHYGQPDHYNMCAKLVVFPIVTSFVYALSLGNSVDLKIGAFYGMEIGCLGLFIVLHLFYTCYNENRWNRLNMLNNPSEDTVSEIST